MRFQTRQILPFLIPGIRWFKSWIGYYFVFPDIFSNVPGKLTAQLLGKCLFCIDSKCLFYFQQPKDKKEEKKFKIKSSDLPIQATLFGQLSSVDMNNYHESECKMIMQDRLEKERVDAKNAVEEYVYDVRSRLSEEFSQFISTEVCKKYNSFGVGMSNID